MKTSVTLFKQAGLVLVAFALIGIIAMNFGSQSLISNAVINEARERQSQRLSLLKRQCRRNKLGTMNDDFNITKLNRKVLLLYSDKHKFIVCEIPKCASSSMKKWLLKFEKPSITSNLTKIPSHMAHKIANAELGLLRLRNASEVQHKMNTYKKLLIVRNPIYRLLSAYRSKMEAESPWNKYFSKMSKKIHAEFSSNHERNSLATFNEFLQFIVTASTKDRHWELYNSLCLPCTMRFDFIAHVETISEDMDYFMQSVNLRNTSFPSNYGMSRRTDDLKVEKYLSHVPTTLLEQVYNNYKLDFELFGFKNPLHVEKL